MRIKCLAFVFILAFFPTSTLACDLNDEIRSVREAVPDQRVTDLSNEICANGQRYDIDPVIIASMIAVESHFRNVQSEIRTRQGREVSCGYMQIQPETFELEASYPPAGETRVQQCQAMIYSWRETLRVAVKHLDSLRDQYGLLNSIGAWNAGPRYGSHNVTYASKVLHYYKEWTE